MAFLNRKEYVSGSAIISHLILGEEPSGAIDGVNTTYTIAFTPVGTSLNVYRNGQRQTRGTDFTHTSGATSFVFLTTIAPPPQPGEYISVDYIK